MFTYICLVLAFILNATANLLVKQSSIYIHLGLLQNWFPTLYGRTVIYAIVCLALSFVCFNFAARSLPISVLYSLHVGMTLLLVTGLAWYLLGERLATMQYVGIFVLILGMILITTNTTELTPQTNKEIG